jgi:rubrerythrin
MIAQARGRAGRGELGPKTGKAELRCSGCGYGLIVLGPPPACPMCRERAWHAFPRGRLGTSGRAAAVRQ